MKARTCCICWEEEMKGKYFVFFLQRRRSKFCIIFHTKDSMLTFALKKCVFCKQDEGMKEERENDICKCSYIKKGHYNIAEKHIKKMQWRSELIPIHIGGLLEMERGCEHIVKITKYRCKIDDAWHVREESDESWTMGRGKKCMAKGGDMLCSQGKSEVAGGEGGFSTHQRKEDLLRA